MQFILGLFVGTFLGILILGLCRCMADGVSEQNSCDRINADLRELALKQ